MNKLAAAPHPEETTLYPKPGLKGPNAVSVAWCYPAPYNVAMASLGYLLLFAQMERHPQADPKRFTTEDYPSADLRPYELMGFSFSYELDIVEVLNALKAQGMPLLACERGEGLPLIFSGGPVPMTNPEPYAPFFDFFLIGEGEELLNEMLEAVARNRHLPKAQQLKALALEVPGLYVPSLIEVSYEPGGAITGFQTISPDIPFPVVKRTLGSLDGQIAASPILSEASVFGKSYLVEVMRGCSHRCRFCLASYSMLPARGASLEELKTVIAAGLPHTHKLGLLGALIADHPQFGELCAWLDTLPQLQISFGALRADTLTPAMCNTLKTHGGKSLTIALESGSPRLRRRINKHLSQEAVLKAAEMVAASGLKRLKLYGMVGLPSETQDDLEQTVALLKIIKQQNKGLELVFGCSTFVPKAWTPFQWMPRLESGELKRRLEFLRKNLVKTADFRPSSPKEDYLQALLSRGDRRLAPFLTRFYQLGGSHGHLNRAFKELNQELSPGQRLDFPEPDWYALRERPETELLPWDVLELAVPKPILYKESLPPPGWV